jgi:hypothetical protein
MISGRRMYGWITPHSSPFPADPADSMPIARPAFERQWNTPSDWHVKQWMDAKEGPQKTDLDLLLLHQLDAIRAVVRVAAAFCVVFGLFPIVLWAAVKLPVLAGHGSILGVLEGLILILALRHFKRPEPLDTRLIARCRLLPRDVCPLLEASAWSTGDLRIAVEEALIRLLPSLRVADAARLTVRHRTLLVGLLRRSDVVLGVSVLRALRHVGDGSEREVVRRLALGRGRLGRHQTVRNAALACR